MFIFFVASSLIDSYLKQTEAMPLVDVPNKGQVNLPMKPFFLNMHLLVDTI